MQTTGAISVLKGVSAEDGQVAPCSSSSEGWTTRRLDSSLAEYEATIHQETVTQAA
jgi:hypothetical protein